MKLALFALLSLITLPVMAATTAISAGGLINALVWFIVIALIFGCCSGLSATLACRSRSPRSPR